MALDLSAYYLATLAAEHQPQYDPQSLTHSMLTCGPACYAGLLDGAAPYRTPRNSKRSCLADRRTSSSASAALAAGKPVEVPFTGTLADGLAVPTMGSNAYEICTAPALPSYCLTCVQGW